MKLTSKLGITSLACSMSAGCMALLPGLVHFHDYEGELAPNPILAVEDGRRVSFVQLTVTKNESSPWRVHPGTVLVEKVESPATRAAAIPTWNGRRQLSDQQFLKRCYEEVPIRRCPQAVDESVASTPTLVVWTAGYVVSTRPMIVAFPVEAQAFAIAKRAVALRARATRPSTTLPAIRGTARPLLASPSQQYNFRNTWVEPIALGVLVDAIQVRTNASGVEVIRLAEPITIDALLDRLTRPDALAELAAERLP